MCCSAFYATAEVEWYFRFKFIWTGNGMKPHGRKKTSKLLFSGQPKLQLSIILCILLSYFINGTFSKCICFCICISFLEMILAKGHVINTNQHNYDRWIHKYKMLLKCKQLVAQQRSVKTIIIVQILTAPPNSPITCAMTKKWGARNPFENSISMTSFPFNDNLIILLTVIPNQTSVCSNS